MPTHTNHPLRRTTDNPNENNVFMDCPRYDKHELSEEQVKKIVEEAAIKAVEINDANFERKIGRRALNFASYVVGAFILGLFALGVKMGVIKL